MTNLDTFIAYQNVCPLCEHQLNLSFILDDKVMSPINKGATYILTSEYSGWQLSQRSFKYKIYYHIDKYTNKFQIEFQSKDGNELDTIPIKMIQEFKNHRCRLGSSNLHLLHSCLNCKQYHHISNRIMFDFEINQIEDIISQEIYFLNKPLGNDLHKIYLLSQEEGKDFLLSAGKTSSKELKNFIFHFNNEMGDEGYFSLTARSLPMRISLPSFKLDKPPEDVIRKLDMFLFFS